MTLREFLVKAKACGYATKGESDELELADGGKELSYREGEYAYRDRYYGFNPFVGEEVVWQDGRVVWAMNYYGRITSGSISSSEVYRFLQKALREVKPDRPFRGPREFADSEFRVSR